MIRVDLSTRGRHVYGQAHGAFVKRLGRVVRGYGAEERRLVSDFLVRAAEMIAEWRSEGGEGR